MVIILVERVFLRVELIKAVLRGRGEKKHKIWDK